MTEGVAQSVRLLAGRYQLAELVGRGGMADSDYPQGPELQRLHAAALAVNARNLATQGLSGTQIGEALVKERVKAIGAARKSAT